jgi:hypothetical protein
MFIQNDLSRCLQPEEVEELVATYEQILRDLDIVERSSPIAQAIARELTELVYQGVRNRTQLTDLVMEELRSG